MLFPWTVSASATTSFARRSATIPACADGAQRTERRSRDAIHLAWDDEQVAEWLNRQCTHRRKLPWVAGYRVDVRSPGGAWTRSADRQRRRPEAGTTPAWSFRRRGRGGSRAGPDRTRAQRRVLDAAVLHDVARQLARAHGPDSRVCMRTPHLPTRLPHLPSKPRENFPARGRQAGAAALRQTYEFRIRLADLTRGVHRLTTTRLRCRMQSRKSLSGASPGRPDRCHAPAYPREPYITLASRASAIRTRCSPEPLPLPDFEADLALGPEREMSCLTRRRSASRSVSSPCARGDTVQSHELYTTSREFAGRSSGSTCSSKTMRAAAFPQAQPDAGPLAMPRARDVRLTFAAIGRDDAGYFALAERSAGRRPRSSCAPTRRSSRRCSSPSTTRLRSFYFQPPRRRLGAATGRPAGAEIGLDHSGLTLAARGQAQVIGCSASLRHTLSPERSALALASGADVDPALVSTCCASSWRAIGRGMV